LNFIFRIAKLLLNYLQASLIKEKHLSFMIIHFRLKAYSFINYSHHKKYEFRRVNFLYGTNIIAHNDITAKKGFKQISLKRFKLPQIAHTYLDKELELLNQWDCLGFKTSNLFQKSYLCITYVKYVAK